MWRPRNGWLLVSPVTTDERLPGSLLVLPDTAVSRMTRWQYEVDAAGPESGIPEGAWIMAPQRVAFDVPEEDVILLSGNEVWAIIAE